jgi:hypothetical protein
MNDQQLEKKVRQNGARIKQDLAVTAGDLSSGFTRLGHTAISAAAKTKEDLSTAVAEGSNQVTEKIERLTSEAKETVVNAAEAVKIDLELGSRKYNANAQKVANRLPGSLGKKAARYPWVTVSIALVIGLVMGGLIKSILTPYPRRHG